MYRGCALAFLALGCAAVVQDGYRLPKLEDPSQPVTRGDTGKVYSSVDEAAFDACAHLWKAYPNARKWEYSGCMFRDEQGIKAGLPETKQLASFCMTPKPPAGTILIGRYHNHLETEEFSAEIDLNTKLDLPLYLCTPSGGVLKYDPVRRVTTRLK